MKNKTITVGGLEIPFSLGDEFYTILEPDRRIRYDDHFQFKVVGPDTVEGLLIQHDGIYIESRSSRYSNQAMTPRNLSTRSE